MGGVMADLGNRKGTLNILKKVKAAEPALLLACIYASLGEADEVFRSPQKALKNKFVPLYLFLLNKAFRRYEKDSQYHEFLRSIGVPQFART